MHCEYQTRAGRRNEMRRSTDVSGKKDVGGVWENSDTYLRQYPVGGVGKIALFTLLEKTDQEVAAFVEDGLPHVRRSQPFDRAVFVSTCNDFRCFRKHGLAAERLPSFAEIADIGGRIPWRYYLNRRKQIILLKWRPELIFDYGISIDDYIEAALR